MENLESRSTLHLFNITWRNSGRYTCEESSSYQSRDIDVFIPGEGEIMFVFFFYLNSSCPVILVSHVSVPPQVQINGLSQWVQVW